MMIVTARKTTLPERIALLERVKPAVGVECLAEQITHDRIALYEVHADGILLGVFAASIDTLIDGTRELVIRHAVAVVDPPRPLTSILSPVFDKVAIDHGVRSVRIHSDKRGLDRIMEHQGYVFAEAVYRKAINVI